MCFLLVIAALSFSGVSARADEPHREAGSASYYTWVDVVDVVPLTRTAYVDEPVERCWRRGQAAGRALRNHPSRRGPPGPRRDGAVDPGALIIGGLLGGIAGNQLGDGRKGATIAGAAVGAVVANEISRSRRETWRERDYAGSSRHESAGRCETRYQRRPVQQIEGFEVTYRYAGRHFTRVVDEPPGERMRIRVSVDPFS